MFEYDEVSELYTADLGNVVITCDEMTDGSEELAEKVAENYAAKLDDIADFLIKEGISDVFGELTPEEIKDGLGVPSIDIGNQIITYADHTLDDAHIISFEYDDRELDGFMYLSITES
ncbi:hypothetical protein [uncultured Ruminococcus sp.]|uniref:hypothetical protein n=1 Tax=uncultured Ruminococcus sp. TaxID=165186 RepID=UPI00262BC8BF|nr:hypothetical protein [uncultured Ruminococcus sp.]